MRARRETSLPEDDVTEVRCRWATRSRRGVDAHAARHRDNTHTRPEPPLAVDRLVVFDGSRFLFDELRAITARFFVLEVCDRLLDGFAVVGVGLQLQVLLEAEDRLVVVLKVPV